MEKIFRYPLIILLSAGAGVAIGIYNAPISAALNITNLSEFLSFLGQLYLFFLQMTVIPIIITAVSSSIGKLIQNKNNDGLIKKIVGVFIVCMILCAIVGMAAGYFGQPGSDLNEETRTLVAFGHFEITVPSAQQAAAQQAASHSSIAGFLTNLIPVNIIHTLSIGNIIAILFFSIVFGIAIGYLKEESALILINLCTAILGAFQKLIIWSMHLLPFGLICLLAGQIAVLDVNIFLTMSKFIIIFGIGTLIIFIVCTIIIKVRSGIRNYSKLFSYLLEPILLSVAARDSMATLPSAINCMEDMKFNSSFVNLTLPLGVTLVRFGNIFYFALAVFFIGQIQNIPFEPIHYLVILIGVIFTGTATAGTSGFVTFSILSLVLNQLNIPIGTALVIFMVIEPIIDPFRNLLIVYVNMAATSLIADRSEESNEALVKPVITEAAINPLLVFIQETQNRPPLLQRSNGVLKGYEIILLKEIARRMGKQLILKDSLIMNHEEEMVVVREAGIIAGVITKTRNPPKGFFFSDSWGTLSIGSIKKPVCFLLPDGKTDSIQIEDIIKDLKREDYFRTINNTEY